MEISGQEKSSKTLIYTLSTLISATLLWVLFWWSSTHSISEHV